MNMNMNIKPLISSSLQTNFLSQFLTSPINSTNTKSEFTLCDYLTNKNDIVNRIEDRDFDFENNNLNINLNNNNNNVVVERKYLKNFMDENKFKKAPSGSVMTFRKSMNSLTSIGFYSSLTSENNNNNNDDNSSNNNRMRNVKGVKDSKKNNLSYNKTSTSNNWRMNNLESEVNSKNKEQTQFQVKVKESYLNNKTNRIGSGVGLDITMSTSLPIGMHGIKNLVSPNGRKIKINSTQITLPPKSPPFTSQQTTLTHTNRVTSYTSPATAKNYLTNIKIIKEDRQKNHHLNSKSNIMNNQKLKVTSENGLRPMTSIRITTEPKNLGGKDKFSQASQHTQHTLHTNLLTIQLKNQSKGNKSGIIKNVKEYNSISSINLNATTKKENNLTNIGKYSKKVHKSEDNLKKTTKKINALPVKTNLAVKVCDPMNINEIISQMKLKDRPVSSSDVAVNQKVRKASDDANRDKNISQISPESFLFNLMNSMKKQPEERKDEFIKNKYKILVEDYGIRNEY